MSEVNDESIQSEFLQALEAQDPKADDIKREAELKNTQLFLRNFTRSSEELKSDLQGLNRDETSKEREMRQLRAAPGKVQNEIDLNQIEMDQTQSNLDKAKADLNPSPKLAEKIKELEAQLEGQKAKEAELKEDLTAAQTKIEEGEKAITDLSSEIAAVSQSLKSIEAHAYNKDEGLFMSRGTAENNALKDRQEAYEKALKSVAEAHGISVADVRDIVDGPVDVPEEHKTTVEGMRTLGFSSREAAALIGQIDMLKEKGEGLDLDLESIVTDTNEFINAKLQLPENSDLTPEKLEIMRENLRKYIGERMKAIPGVIEGMESDFGDDWKNRKWEINQRLQDALSDIDDVMTASSNVLRMSDPAEKRAFMESDFVKTLLAQNQKQLRLGAVHEDQTWAWRMENFMADARNGLTSENFDPTKILGQDWGYSSREGENLSAGVDFLNNNYFSIPSNEIDNVLYAGNGGIGRKIVVEVNSEKISVGGMEEEMALIESGKLPTNWRDLPIEIARASSDPNAETPDINFLSREDQEAEAKVWKAYLAAVGIQVIPYAGAVPGLVADIGDLNPFSDQETTMAVLRATGAIPEDYRLDKTTADYFLGGAGVILTAFGIQALSKGAKAGRKMPRALRAIARLDDVVPAATDLTHAEIPPVAVSRVEAPLDNASTLRRDVAELSGVEMGEVTELENAIRLREGSTGRRAELLDGQITKRVEDLRAKRVEDLRAKGVDVDAILEARRANVAPVVQSNVVEFPVMRDETVGTEVSLPRAVGDGITPVHRADPPQRVVPGGGDNVVDINAGKADETDDRLASLKRIEDAEIKAKREADFQLFKEADSGSMESYNRFVEEQAAARRAEEMKTFQNADAYSMRALDAANDNRRADTKLISTARAEEARRLDAGADSNLIRLADLRKAGDAEVPPVSRGVHPIHMFEAGRIATNVPALTEALVVPSQVQAKIDAESNPEAKLSVLTENLNNEVLRGKKSEILAIFEKYPDRESAFKEWHKINAEIAKLYGIEGLEMGEAAYAEGSESLRFGTKIQELFREDIANSGLELTARQQAMLADGKFGFESMQLAKLSLSRIEQADVASPVFAEAVTKLATEATTSTEMINGVARELGITNIPAGPVGTTIRKKIARQIQLATGIDPADGVLGPNSRETLKSVDWGTIDLTKTINKPPIVITAEIGTDLSTFTTGFSGQRLNSLDTATTLGKMLGIEARTPAQVKAINEAYQTALNQGLPAGEQIKVDGVIGSGTRGAAAKVNMGKIDWSAFKSLSA